MPNLATVQQDFQDYLLQQSAAVDSHVVNTVKVATAVRLGIYGEGYYLRLLEVLQQDYPALCLQIGEVAFAELSQNYIKAYPSRYRSLRWFGENLVNFLTSRQAPIWQVELAIFEWTLNEIFDAPDYLPINLNDMAQLLPAQWPALCFILADSVCLLPCHWNSVELWQATKTDSLAIPTLLDKPINCLVWRKDYAVQFRSVTLEEHYLLEAMRMKQPFSVLCEGLCKWIDEAEVALQAAQLLKRLIVDELVRGFNFS